MPPGTFRLMKNHYLSIFIIIIIATIIIVITIKFDGKNNLKELNENKSIPFIPNNNNTSISVMALMSIPTADKYLAYCHEIIHFSSNQSQGDISKRIWNFNDGMTSEQINPSHYYEHPGWYNVSLLLISSYGNKSSAKIRIGIQMNNVDWTLNYSYAVDLKLKQTSGPGNKVTISPNIGNPTGIIEISILHATASFEIKICLWQNISDNYTGDSMILYSEKKVVINNNYSFIYYINPSDLPSEIGKTNATLRASVGIQEGICIDISIHISLFFPLGEYQ